MLNSARKNKLLFSMTASAHFDQAAQQPQACTNSLFSSVSRNFHSSKLTAVSGSSSLWFGTQCAKRPMFIHGSFEEASARQLAQKGGDD